MSIERTTQTRNAGPLDVMTTTWSGHMGKMHWSRSRATRVLDSRTGKTERVGRMRRAALPGAVAAAAVTGTAGLVASGMRRRSRG